jgi:serine/threonine protein kinase/lipopolysaccharide biosynthesis regulator YciM
MKMKPEHWQQLDQVLEAALERSPDKRAAFLAEACAGDESLRQKVESLLRSEEAAEGFIETPAAPLAFGVLADKQAHSLIGQQLGQYKILSPLGAGGMGEVYLAQDARLGRKVALKLLPAQFTFDADRVRRFEREGRAASALNHPNIVTIHDFGEANGTYYIATELIEGQTLRRRLAGGPMNLREAIEVAQQAAEALATAHAAGIIHRDIKPENIMLRTDGYVKVLDFGLAKLTEHRAGFVGSEAATQAKDSTEAGMMIGTVQYMSPEQARGQKVDARSDIFSLGVVLYEMLAGQSPFAGTTTADVIAAILDKEPAPLSPQSPPELQQIVGKALRKDREARYQTVKDFLTDLKDLKERLTFEAKLERTEPPEAANATQIHRAATGEMKKQTAETSNSFARIISRKSVAALGLTALLVAALVVVYYSLRAKSVTADLAAPNSIALLPFANGSGDTSFDYLSDGLSESVIDRLTQLPQLKIIARNSSFKYRGNNLDLQEVAKALGVDAIVTGRVTQKGDNLSVRVELIDVRANRQLWSESYNRKATDAVEVQREIAQTVSEKLRLRLTGAQEQQLVKTVTTNPEAYQLYLTGLFVSKTSLKKSLDYFTQAMILDPNFAPALYRLSWCYFYLGYNGEFDPKESTPKARATLQRALELDDTLAEAHQLMAEIKRSEWDWTGADKEWDRVLELNPNTIAARQVKALRLAKAGRIEEAVNESRLTQALDPLAINLKIPEGAIFYRARRFDEAIAKFQQIVKLAPDNSLAHVWLGYSYAAKGMYQEAIAEYQQDSKIYGDSTSNQCSLGHALAKLGKRREALILLNKVKTSKEYVSPTELAVLYIGLGDKEGAFQALEKAFAARDLQLQNLTSDPIYDDLHNDPRFHDLVRRVGLP